MIRIAPTSCLVAITVAAWVTTSAQAQPRRRAPEPAPSTVATASPDIRVQSGFTQTAAWIGDPLAFVVEISMAPGVEIVAADLDPEKLGLEGLELGRVTSSVATQADGWRTLRQQYDVRAWDTAPPKRIADLVVRFRRPVTTQTADGSAPAAELRVPGATVSMRSTLPDDGSAAGARDRQAALPSPSWISWLRPAGLGFVALGAAPVVLWVVGRTRSPRPGRPRPSRRSLHALSTALLDELQTIETRTPEGRRGAYDRIDHDLRAYIAQAVDVPAAALTADELRPRVATARGLKGEALCDLLAACEHARYAPLERLPDIPALEETVARLRDALAP